MCYEIKLLIDLECRSCFLSHSGKRSVCQAYCYNYFKMNESGHFKLPSWMLYRFAHLFNKFLQLTKLLISFLASVLKVILSDLDSLIRLCDLGVQLVDVLH